MTSVLLKTRFLTRFRAKKLGQIFNWIKVKRPGFEQVADKSTTFFDAQNPRILHSWLS